MKNKLVFVLVVAVVISALSIISTVRISSRTNYESYVNSLQCDAQGDIRPEPFDKELIVPQHDANEKLCITQSDKLSVTNKSIK